MDLQLANALLGLGLEDLTPLPEAINDPEVLEAAGGTLTPERLAEQLMGLLRAGSISVWVGHWLSDQTEVVGPDAETLLRDPASYLYQDPGNGERVWFLNVDNDSSA